MAFIVKKYFYPCYGRIICVLLVRIIYGHIVVVMRGAWGGDS